jgi:DNA-binding response OmpR family regulator
VVSILVVDDDPPIRRMLERTLSAEGYEVVWSRTVAPHLPPSSERFPISSDGIE